MSADPIRGHKQQYTAGSSHILLVLVGKLLCEALLDGRVVGFDKMVIAELQGERTLANAAGAENGNLALPWRNRLARRCCRGRSAG